MKTTKKTSHAPARAFSLMELLVVISIIVTTLSLVLPAYMKTRETAVKTLCQLNLKNIGMGDVQYRTDNRDWMLTMRNYYAPSPTSGANNVFRPEEPAIYNELWPISIRWCPSLKRASGYVESNFPITPGQPPVAASDDSYVPSDSPIPQTYYWSPVNFTRYTTFGYARPAVDFHATLYYPSQRMAFETNYASPYTTPAYVRMDYPGDAAITYYGNRFRAEGPRPIAADLIESIGTYAHVTPHNGYIGKTNGLWPRDPQGSNALWSDYSVQWTNFPGKERTYEFKDIATGVSHSIPGPIPEKAFAKEGTVIQYYFPARQR